MTGTHGTNGRRWAVEIEGDVYTYEVRADAADLAAGRSVIDLLGVDTLSDIESEAIRSVAERYQLSERWHDDDTDDDSIPTKVEVYCDLGRRADRWAYRVWRDDDLVDSGAIEACSADEALEELEEIVDRYGDGLFGGGDGTVAEWGGGYVWAGGDR